MTGTTRPRSAHKLNLRDGDVVELVGWQDGDVLDVGRVFSVMGSQLLNAGATWNNPPQFSKGQRPLFTVISRAADERRDAYYRAKEWAGHNRDEVIVRYAGPLGFRWGDIKHTGDTQRFTITFPHGSDTGTVKREKL